MNEINISQLEKMIFTIRGHKVMLDSDLALLYGVETKRLNEQVRRNLSRFPEDFMFECSSSDLAVMRSQIATASLSTGWNYRRSSTPLVFTENGVAMLSSVLNSEQAIQVNIAIMRIFTKLRSFLVLEHELRSDMKKLKEGTQRTFQAVFERMDAIEDIINPTVDPKRKKIGF